MNKLVYVRYEISKGSFYYPILQYNKWKTIDFNEINWNEDHVFSFILAPVERYLSGVSFDLLYNPALTEILLNQGAELFKNLLIITPHSVPIHNIFFDHVNNIDWIPAGDGLNDEDNFKKLCAYHGIELDWNTSVTSQAFRNIRDIKAKVRAMLENDIGFGISYLWAMLAEDIDLYGEIQKNFNGNAVLWPDVSWRSQRV
jgi:hypothetical protein